jgi:hypothetical protein
MQRTERSSGVTTAAVVALLCSSLVALLCPLTLLPIFVIQKLPPAPPEAAPPANFRIMLVGAALLYAALAAWGIATGVGLFRLRAWARASILVFSGLEVFVFLFSAPMLFIVSRMPQMQAQAPGFQTGTMIVLAFMGLVAAVGVWWLVLFNLKSVRAQFDETRTTGAYAESGDSAQARAMRPHRPLSVTIIACLYLLGTPGIVFALIRPFPGVLLGWLLEGNAARAVHCVNIAVGLAVGIGLLRLKPWARLLGIYVAVWHWLNSLIFSLLPGHTEQLVRVMMQLNAGNRQPFAPEIQMIFLRFAWGAGWVATLLIVWILVRNKAAFTPNTPSEGQALAM